MSKNLRADMDEEQFYRFKALKGKLGVTTNDEAIVELMDTYEADEDQKDEFAEAS